MAPRLRRSPPKVEPLSETRKFLTLDSIPKSAEEYQFLSDIIDIEDILFGQQISNDTIETIYNKIASLLEKNNHDSLYLQYINRCLFYHLLIRPKQFQHICNFIAHLYFSNSKEESKAIQSILKNNNFYHSMDLSTIRYILYHQGLVNERPIESVFQISTWIFSESKISSISSILFNDDLQILKSFMAKNPNKLLPQTTLLDNHNNILSALEFCAYHGSSKCFDFLFSNGFAYKIQSLKKNCIIGGNFDIIHTVEQNNINFNYCFKFSVQYHHKNISNWLLTKYSCELFPMELCITFCNYHSFIFMLLNYENINKEIFRHLSTTFIFNESDVDWKTITCTKIYDFIITNSTLNPISIKLLCDVGVNINKELLMESDLILQKFTVLHCMCVQNIPNLKSIQSLIDFGADVNQILSIEDKTITDAKQQTKTILYYLCQQNNIHDKFELIKLLLENNADPNIFQCSCYTTRSIPYKLSQKTIFFSLFKKCNINYGLIELIIQKGGDINKEKKIVTEHSQLLCTPLSYFCQKGNVNMQLMKFMLDNGADPNKEYISIDENNKKEYVYTPLMSLIKHYKINISAISLLLSSGADINKLSKEKIYDEEKIVTPIFYLITNRKLPIQTIQFFIDNGADINKECTITTQERQTTTKSWHIPLSYLCLQTSPYFPYIELLIRVKSDINKPIFSIVEDKSSQIQYYRTLVTLVCQSNPLNIELLQYLLENKADVNKMNKEITSNSEKQYSLLCYLCKLPETNISVIKLILDYGADTEIEYNKQIMVSRFFNNTYNKYVPKNSMMNNHKFNDKKCIKYTPLSFLCMQEFINMELIKLLIDYGANVNCIIQNDTTIQTPLIYLCKQENHNLQLIKYLVEHGANVNCFGEENGTKIPLLVYICVRKTCDMTLLKYILDNGADTNIEFTISNAQYLSNPISYTLLPYLCKQNNTNIEIIKFLLCYGADVNKEIKESFSDFTSLGYACKKDFIDVELIKILLENGADFNKGTKSPLIYLCQNQDLNIEAIELLMDNGIDANMEVKDGLNNTITMLSYICKQEKVDIELIKLLIKRGADLNRKQVSCNTQETSTPLLYLCQKKNIPYEAVECLLKNGADVDDAIISYVRKRDDNKLLSLFVNYI